MPDIARKQGTYEICNGYGVKGEFTVPRQGILWTIGARGWSSQWDNVHYRNDTS